MPFAISTKYIMFILYLNIDHKTESIKRRNIVFIHFVINHFNEPNLEFCTLTDKNNNRDRIYGYFIIRIHNIQ
jgi:hypothetical protein